MCLASNDVMIKIQGDISGLQKELQEVQKELKGLGKTTGSAFEGITSTIKKVGGVVATAFAVDKIKDFGVYALQSASDVEEMENKFNVVFKDMGASVDKWASDFANAIGRTKTEIKTGVSNLGDLLTGYGMTEKSASDLSQKVIELSYDLASFNNVQDADAIDRMTKGILGEHEGLKALGISLNETNLQAKMMEMGLSGQFAKLDEVTKAQVRWNVMLDQTKNAQGDAVRSADSYANSVKTLKARIQDSVEAFGKELLPLATEVVQAMIPVADALIPIATAVGKTLLEALKSAIEMMQSFGEKLQEVKKWMSEHKLEVTAIALVLGALATALIVSAVQVNAFGLATQLATLKTTLFAKAQLVLARAMSGLKTIGSVVKGAFNPYTLAIMGGIAVGYLIIKNWDLIKETAIQIFTTVSDLVKTKMEEIKTTFITVWNSISDFCQGVWDGICNIVSFAIQFVGMIIQGAMVGIQAIWGIIWQLIGDTVTNIWNGINSVISTVCGFIWGVITNYLTLIFNFWTTVLTGIKTVVTVVFNVIKSVISSVLQVISNIVSTVWNGIKTVVTTVCNVIQSIVSTIWNGIKTVITTVCNTIKSIVSTVWNGIKTVISTVGDGIKSKVSSIFNGVRDTIKGAMDKAKSIVSGAFDKIKSIFNTVLKPNIKLPHLEISGKFSLNPPSVPKFGLSWYQTGGIFTGASVIGVGENGDEAVVPLSNKSRMRPFAEAVAKMMPDNTSGVSGSGGGDININVSQLVVREDADIQRIAKELKTLQDRENRKKGIR